MSACVPKISNSLIRENGIQLYKMEACTMEACFFSYLTTHVVESKSEGKEHTGIEEWKESFKRYRVLRNVTSVVQLYIQTFTRSPPRKSSAY